MPAERISMRKIREILRLKYELKLSDRVIGESCKTSKTSVARCLERARQAKISWPLSPELDDEQLEQLLYPSEIKLNLDLLVFLSGHC